MKLSIVNTFLSIIFALILFGNFNAAAQNLSQCQPPETDVAVYNFVPEAQLQTGDFRPLLKTEKAFVQKLRETENFNVSDFTTQIPPAEIQPDAPPISGDLQPPPAQLQEPYFFVGQITKTANGFSLSVQLKKSADSSLLNEVKTPFASADGAEAAGNTNAAAMIAFLVSQAQAARDNRETSDHAIDPHIDLIIDKLQLKPNETSPVKIVLSDCDGVRLKHRTIEAFLQLKHGDTPVQEDTLVRVTDEKGERNGVIGAHEPGVITYIAKFKYKDVMGVPRERTDTKTIVVSGGESDLWQMSVRWQYRERDRYLNKDLLTHRTAMGATVRERKGDYVFLFKVPTSPEGSVFTNEIKNFNGFGSALFRSAGVDFNYGYTVSFASGTADQNPDSIQNIQAGFSIDPDNKEFQFNLSGILFRGVRDSRGCGRIADRYECQSKHDEFVDSIDGADKLSGGIPITPEMIRSGVYTYSFQENKLLPVNHTKSATSDQTNEGSYVSNRVELKVSRVNPNRGKIIN